jgi:hypothetical protein
MVRQTNQPSLSPTQILTTITAVVAEMLQTHPMKLNKNAVKARS